MEKSVRMTPYWAIMQIEDEDYLHYYDSRDEMLRACSKQIAFDDCGGVWPVRVVEHGKVWRYQGWQPGMVYEWVREDGKNWREAFPEWDH